MVGKSIPLYCSGVGKALLADMKDEKVKKIWDHSEIRKLTDYTVVYFVKFQNLIAVKIFFELLEASGINKIDLF